MFTKGSLEQSRTSTMQLFFSSVKPYFKNVLNSIELPLGSIFCTTQAKEKKLLVSIWAPGWYFFFDDAAGELFFETTSELKKY